ncbi:MAG: delta-aminolevulinic acid dehydratase [Chitinophagales bacterium]|nr:MAG: delta-aminolevulinic acid dehydratase [Chitinophagales bacterium]
MFPLSRGRRLRKTEAIRQMVAETHLSVSDLIAPLFVVEGNNKKEPIASLPGYYRFSVDRAVREAHFLFSQGIRAVLVFARIPVGKKDNTGKEALNPRGLLPRAIRAIKRAVPELCVMSDVALDPYSVYGHDGIVTGRQIDNDATLQVLAKMALLHARAGADFVAPSDMMDGRILKIREILEHHGYQHTGIMAYSVKYASGLYGPFRDALDSAPAFGDKKSYQMDYANAREAIREACDDVAEGADIVMVKPALAYLDIIWRVRQAVKVPVAAYQVSGEYAMVKAAAGKGWLHEQQAMLEILTAIRRAGADLIATYFVYDFLRLQGNENAAF